jgi:hypothetical protein
MYVYIYEIHIPVPYDWCPKVTLNTSPSEANSEDGFVITVQRASIPTHDRILPS